MYLQHGSRFIQQHLEMATDEEKAEIFAELQQHVVQLISDLSGNYVIQKFFAFGNSQQVETLSHLLEGNVVSLSLQTYGCRVVQKAIENLPQEAQVSNLPPFLSPLPLSLLPLSPSPPFGAPPCLDTPYFGASHPLQSQCSALSAVARLLSIW